MIHRWIELSKSFRMDLYLLYKFFDLKKLMTSDTPLEREWVRVRVKRCTHLGDLVI